MPGWFGAFWGCSRTSAFARLVVFIFFAYECNCQVFVFRIVCRVLRTSVIAGCILGRFHLLRTSAIIYFFAFLCGGGGVLRTRVIDGVFSNSLYTFLRIFF